MFIWETCFSHTWMCHDVTVEVIQLCSVLWSFHMQTPFMFAQLQLKTVAHLLFGQKKHHMWSEFKAIWKNELLVVVSIKLIHLIFLNKILASISLYFSKVRIARKARGGNQSGYECILIQQWDWKIWIQRVRGVVNIV